MPFSLDLRLDGLRMLLAPRLIADMLQEAFCYADERDDQGRQAVVRNGYLPEREVQTGMAPIPICVPRVRDCSGQGIRFHQKTLGAPVVHGGDG